MSTALEFENISKQYRLGTFGGTTLRADLQRWWAMSVMHREDPFLKIGEANDRTHKGESEYVWALKNINFRVEQGDVIGIIGRNGAGKSTLLKLLARVTGPTTGEIRIKGRIGSLLEVGTGFHPEMTGRENVYMNGIILGMTKQEVKRKFDEIVDFSGCERYIDTPVKRYSSGMLVRLAFAVAAHLDPEILVVDEVLAVGDAEFQKKAIGKMQDISKEEGRTVLFVSHNIPIIKKLCKKGIVLQNGCLYYSGTADECVDKYLNNQKHPSDNLFDLKHDIIYYSTSFQITSVLIDGNPPKNIFLDDGNQLEIYMECSCILNFNIEFIARLYDQNDVLVASYSCTNSKGKTYHVVDEKCVIREIIHLPPTLTNSEYRLEIHIAQKNINYLAKIPCLVRIIKRGFVSPHTSAEYNPKESGYFIMD